jgi:hypothetical protein
MLLELTATLAHYGLIAFVCIGGIVMLAMVLEWLFVRVGLLDGQEDCQEH